MPHSLLKLMNLEDASLPYLCLRPAQLDYSAFSSYLAANQPVILPNSATASWPSREKWSTSTDLPDWDVIARLYGSRTVCVTDCDPMSKGKGPEERLLSEVIDGWRRGEGLSLYVKDFHLALSGVEPFYETPDMYVSYRGREGGS